MAKVIEEVNTYRTEIRKGDLVKCNDEVCIVTAVLKERKAMTSIPAMDEITTYDLTSCKTGNAFNNNGRAVELYHGTIKLSNE